MINWRQWLFILVNSKKQRSWHDKRLNMTHWPIKPGKAWLGSFLSRESLMTPKLQPTAAGGRRWQVFVAIQRGDGQAALREAEREPNERYQRFELALAHYGR